MEIKQKYLKKGGLIALITVLGMVAPLSTDMYMPSLPSMAEYFHAPTVVVNFTLVVFFLFMALGTLVFGPLSDKYGRKKILLFSLVMYGVGSLASAAAVNVWMLIVVRAVQASGGGGMVAVSVAVIKDAFDGKTRDSALAVVQSMSVIAPIIAPIVGAQILRFASWRFVFIVLTGIAVLCIVAALFFEETIHEDEIIHGSIGDSLKQIFVVSRNMNFTPYLIVVSLYGAPIAAYLATASYIYINFFGLSETSFSLFFAVNAAFSVAGPMIFMATSGKFTVKKIMNFLIIFTMALAVLMFIAGRISPVVFICCFIPFSILSSYLRPLSTSILLDQQEGDTGSASALLNFAGTIFCCIGMFIGSLAWSDYISGLSITMFGFMVLTLIGWIWVCKSKKINMKGM